MADQEFPTYAWRTLAKNGRVLAERTSITHRRVDGEVRALCGMHPARADVEVLAVGRDGEICALCEFEAELLSGRHEVEVLSDGPREDIGVPAMSRARCSCGWRRPRRPVRPRDLKQRHRNHVWNVVMERLGRDDDIREVA